MTADERGRGGCGGGAMTATRDPVWYTFGDGTPLVDLWHLSPDDVTVERIARGLGNICRYSGQVRRYYSVAEHSILVASQVPPEDQMAALLHDASEALGLGDLPAPVKALCPVYRELEAVVMAVVEARFGLEPGACSRPFIKAADRAVYLAEQRTLRRIDLAKLPASEQTARPASVHFWCHAPYTAGEHWASAFSDAESERIWAADRARKAGGAT